LAHQWGFVKTEADISLETGAKCTTWKKFKDLKGRYDMGNLTWTDLALFSAIAILILLPPRFDPAIRLKEWNERVRTKSEAE
jgi:hypothetical protein